MHELDVLRNITDPAERAGHATKVIAELDEASGEAGHIRLTAMRELQAQGMPQEQIAAAIGITRARVGQLLKNGPPPWRALIAPSPREPATVAVVRKRADDSGGRALAEPTQDALGALTEAAAGYLKIKLAKWERIQAPGLIDLNRGNLVVLIGPRISALIGQAISADPVIKWREDRAGNWFITDTTTGTDYHSDFDKHTGTPSADSPVCYAHIGRLPRPDRQGTFLYIGGEHATGTAGAVNYLLADGAAIYDEVRRASAAWSAIVKTTAEDDSEMPASWERITPIYKHGSH